MKLFLLYICLFLSLLGLGQSNKIIVGGDYNYPPYSFINSKGVEAGYDVDVINAIASKIDMQVEFKFMNWDTTLQKLHKGEVDVIASIVYSEEREKHFDFTFPLHTEYYAIFSRKKVEIKDVIDLHGKRPAYLKGDISNESFLVPMGLLADSLPVRSLPDAFAYVDSGMCDYVIAPYPLGMKILKEKVYRNIEVKGTPIIPSVYCLAVKEGNAKLIGQLNMGIELLSRNGELERIYQKWVKYKRQEDFYQSIFDYAVIIVGGLLMILLVMLLFWYSLRNQVKKKTLQIKDAEEIYQKVFNSVDDVLLVFNREGEVVDANQKALNLYDLSYNEMVGKKYVTLINKDNIDLFQGLVDSYESESFSFNGEVSKVTNGEVTYLHVNSVRLKLDKEERYLAVLHDITKKKNSILKLEEAKRLADEANNAKSTFLATVSHEIRTPLNAIIGYSNLLQKTQLERKQAAYNEKIIVSSELLLSLINDMLDLTKIDAKKLQLQSDVFNLSELVGKVCDVSKYKAINKGLKYNLSIGQDLPKILVGDELRLSQILMNVLSNAVKFTSEGVVSFNVYSENAKITEAQEEINIIFSIRDTGIGISLENQEKLFNPFEQAQNTNKRKYGGTGLGLAITKQLVELMGGDICVESSLDKGSIFIINLPFRIFYGQTISKDSFRDYSKELSSLNEISVLLVEDNLFNAEILINQLADYKINVTHAESGAIALRLLMQNTFHIIFMDIEMPDMDGFETTMRIKELEMCTPPIIALSAHSLDSEKTKALEIGMVAYLSKPVKVEQILEVILKYAEVDKIDIRIFKMHVNFDKGLSFFGGNELMYKRGLARFLENYKTIPDFILGLFEHDKKQLKTLMHNLKSGAELIGAEKLAESARNCDRKLGIDNQLLTENEVNDLMVEFKELITDISFYA